MTFLKSRIKPIRIILADTSVKKSLGVIKDLMIKIEEEFYPIDVIMIKVEHNKGYSLLLSRVFYKTLNFIINTKTKMMECYLENKKFTIKVFDIVEKDLEDELNVEGKIKPNLFI